MLAPVPSPLAAVDSTLLPPLIPPGLLFLLCAAAAVGTILLLPGKLEAPLRKIGGVILLSSGIILAALLAKSAGGMNAYFWIFSAIAIVAAIRVITHTKPVYSALYFVLTVMASAGLFVLMWAEFMAAALVLIYAGAILVTYVFVIMLAAEAHPAGGMGQKLAEHDAISREPIVASAVGFALLGVLLFVIFDRAQGRATTPPLAPEAIFAQLAESTIPGPQPTFPAPASHLENQSPVATFVPVGQTQQLGAYLFQNQLVNLELAGLILTVAMVGAIVIARKRVVGPPATEAGGLPGQILIAPMTPINDNPHSIPVAGTENPRQKEYPQT